MPSAPAVSSQLHTQPFLICVVPIFEPSAPLPSDRRRSLGDTPPSIALLLLRQRTRRSHHARHNGCRAPPNISVSRNENYRHFSYSVRFTPLHKYPLQTPLIATVQTATAVDRLHPQGRPTLLAVNSLPVFLPLSLRSSSSVASRRFCRFAGGSAAASDGRGGTYRYSPGWDGG